MNPASSSGVAFSLDFPSTSVLSYFTKWNAGKNIPARIHKVLYLPSNLLRLLTFQHSITIHIEIISNNPRTTQAINTHVNNISTSLDDVGELPLTTVDGEVMKLLVEFMTIVRDVLLVVLVGMVYDGSIVLEPSITFLLKWKQRKWYWFIIVDDWKAVNCKETLNFSHTV